MARFKAYVSPILAEHIGQPVGDYVAQETVARINAYGALGYILPTEQNLSGHTGLGSSARRTVR